eukprot:CAMPEP_0202911712 /NCGR_PEP_ID=MMETSP1392-20130828/55710_1 /ASSEMBLY_ACC=CAM_ASM_000868 /TAXON_ID=225041 /ORGANISM="Chlamydomonas chlamydogama, Strain SAG 11-48b" /LENGTH=482 /DNA_ID=CAMNT_0049602329 /DNA_START=288 /DNA_END=1736 /DNA_ORIENTATION=+
MEVLQRFARRAVLDPSIVDAAPHFDTFRFPTQEFRSLALNGVGKLTTNIDRGIWNRVKVELCGLLLLFEDAQAATAELLAPQLTSPTKTRRSRSPSPTTEPSVTHVAGLKHTDSTTSLSPTVVESAAQAFDGAVVGPEELSHAPSAAEQVASSSQQQASSPDASSSSTPCNAGLMQLVDICMQRDRLHMSRVLDDPLVPEEQKAKLRNKFEGRRQATMQQLLEWCRTARSQPGYRLLEPVLKQVLQVDPAPLVENRRDGSKTEVLMQDLVAKALPPGWSLYSGAHLLSVEGQPFKNEKFLKGEADLLLVDPEGVVQAVLEVKTAGGNLFLALYEDVIRFLRLVEKVRGRWVTFMPSGGADVAVTLRFVEHLRPVYILGCELAPEDLEAVVLSAHSKLLTMEIGRLLSSRVEAWEHISIQELTREVAILQVQPAALLELYANVRKYFEVLASCDIYTLQESSLSQRAVLAAEAAAAAARAHQA